MLCRISWLCAKLKFLHHNSCITTFFIFADFLSRLIENWKHLIPRASSLPVFKVVSREGTSLSRARRVRLILRCILARCTAGSSKKHAATTLSTRLTQHPAGTFFAPPAFSFLYIVFSPNHLYCNERRKKRSHAMAKKSYKRNRKEICFWGQKNFDPPIFLKSEWNTVNEWL